MALIELKNICKSYPDGDSKRVILDNINLNVDKNEIIAIVGPSGSGKSTLLTIIGLLLESDSGEVIIDGNSINDKKQNKWTKLRKEYIGFIFQSHQLLPYLKAYEQLTEFQDKSKKNIISIDSLLNDLELTDVKNHYPSKMSGGEKQRVAIARAFVNDPKVILADEPTASLDSKRGRIVVEMIRKEVKARGKACIMVTHDERVLDLVDKVYHLENGKLV